MSWPPSSPELENWNRMNRIPLGARVHLLLELINRTMCKCKISTVAQWQNIVKDSSGSSNSSSNSSNSSNFAMVIRILIVITTEVRYMGVS